MHRLGWRVILACLATAALSLGAAGIASAHRARFRHVHGAAARQQAFRARLRAQAHKAAGRARASSLNSTAGDSDLADESAAVRLRTHAPRQRRVRAGAGQRGPAGWQLGSSAGRLAGGDHAAVQRGAANYTDPFWSNIGAGFSLVGGRSTALAQDPDGAWFAGAADGGVWRSTDQGATWPRCSTPCRACRSARSPSTRSTARCGSGTGEANTRQDSYAGTGVYRAADDGTRLPARRRQRDATTRSSRTPSSSSRLTAQGTPTPPPTTACSATPRHRAVDRGAGPGRRRRLPAVRQPDDVGGRSCPGSGGRDVIAAIGWRGPSEHAEQRLLRVHGRWPQLPPGHGHRGHQRRRHRPHHVRLLRRRHEAVRDRRVAARSRRPAESMLQGIFVATGSPASVAGPWTKIADEAKLAAPARP